MSDSTVARTIIAQLAGSAVQLKLFLGAFDLVYSDSAITFKWKAKAKNSANCCRITLEPSDTYKVEFLRVWGTKVKAITEMTDIYNDQLREIFERETGLYVRM